jgi:hypothetical protein
MGPVVTGVGNAWHLGGDTKGGGGLLYGHVSHSRPLSVASGLLALFVRELTLPFVVVMLLMAHRERRREETIAWLLGIAVFSLYLAVHAIAVSGMLVESDRANDTWIQFGGWSFVLATTKWTLPTFFSPWWVDVVLLPLVLIGVTGWRGAVGKRVAWTIGLYVLAFLIAGRSDNHYWGLMYAPLIPLGLVHAPRSLADLWRVTVGMGRQPYTHR